MTLKEELREWTLVFLKNRDLYKQEIERIEKLDGDFVVHKKNTRTRFMIRPELDDVGEVAREDGALSVVLLNRQKNVDAVAKGWDKIKDKPNLCIFFVNPLANEKWMIFPKTHDLITEREALKKGLESLASAVPEC